MENPHDAEKYQPFVVFVVLNWNQAALTLDCLRSLSLQAYSNFKVIVVDNGSSDGSPSIIKKEFPGVIVLENEKNLGYSEGNNVGIRAAQSLSPGYIFLLNNDTVVDPAMLSRLVSVAETDRKIGIVGPTMYYFDPPDMLWGGENRIDWTRGAVIRMRMGERIGNDTLKTQIPKKTAYIDSCAMLVRAEVFEKVGFLDGNFFINYDDLDLNVRAVDAGYEVVYVPAAFMWHKVSAAMGLASPATTYYMTRNSLLFFWKHSPASLKLVSVLRILLRTFRTLMAWTFLPSYHDGKYTLKKNALLYAVRDFITKRFGKMGSEVSLKCSSMLK